MTFFTLWKSAYLNPGLALQELKSKAGPYYGLAGIIICWLSRDLLIILPWYFMGLKPFQPSYISFLTPDNYYFWEMFFLPDFGLITWLINSALIYLFLRITECPCDFDKILNLTGIVAVIITPIVLVVDWLVYFLDLRNIVVMAVTHFLLAIWSIVLTVLGLKVIFEVKVIYGLLLSLLTTGLYIFIAALVVR